MPDVPPIDDATIEEMHFRAEVGIPARCLDTLALIARLRAAEAVIEAAEMAIPSVNPLKTRITRIAKAIASYRAVYPAARRDDPPSRRGGNAG